MSRVGAFSFGLLLALWIAAGETFSQDQAPKKEPGSPSVESPKKKSEPAKGCCRIKYEGGGFDYFPSTEEECVSKPNFDSFQRDSALCFQSLWD